MSVLEEKHGNVCNKLYPTLRMDVMSLSGVTGGGGSPGAGGQSAPQRFLTGKFLLTYREKRGKEKKEKG